jgi:ABC-type transport system involved in multi-copper enzyme maturation permease subunit
MTAGTVTPYRPPRDARKDRFWQLAHAEWTKFRTVRGWVIAAVLAVVLIDVVGLLVVHPQVQCGSGSGAACLPRVPTGPGGEAVNDSFYFVRQPLAGNGSITVRVTSLTGAIDTTGGRIGPGQSASPGLHRGVVPWAKAGIIIKQSTRPGSAYAAMMVTGRHGVRMQYDYTGDQPGLTGRVSAAAPRWLRLVRSGDTITGYDSASGTRWARVGTAHLAGLAGTVQAGLFAAAPLAFTPNFSSYGESGGSASPSLATGVLDHVSLRGGRPGRQWAGTEVGASGANYQGPRIGVRRAGGRFTVTGAGDIGPVVSGGANSSYDTTTIADHLLGVFLGLIVMIVIAAMFVTVEYRRGLIRTTLAASPRRGRLLAAKALVIGLVTFVLGTAAAAVAVIVGIRVSRAGGQYVLPVSSLTELRVIAGTGLMLALASVLAMSIGVVLRRSVATVAAVTVAIAVPYILGVAGVLPAGAAEWVLRVSPAAAFAIEQGVPQYSQVIGQYGPPDYFPLAPWAGLAVLGGYTAVALGLAAYVLRRRDA